MTLGFTIHRDTLADAINTIARTLPARPNIPVLAGVLINATPDGVILSGFDYEVSTQTRVTAENTTAGAALVSGKLLAGITKALPNKPVTITETPGRVTLACGAAKFTLPTMPVEDYPQLPELPTTAGKIDTDLFTSAAGQVLSAVGKDDTLPMLTGVRVEIDGPQIVMAATDRFRLAIRTLEWEPDTTGFETAFLVPGKTLTEVTKSFATHAPIELSISDTLLGIVNNGTRTTTRLLDAEFPKFRQLLPKEHTAQAVIDVDELTQAVKRVSLLAERGAQVRLEFTEGTVTLTAGGDELGRAEERLSIEFEGEPLTIAFNPGYLLDGLNAVKSELVRFGFTTANRPAILQPTDSDGFTYLLMPVRLPS